VTWLPPEIADPSASEWNRWSPESSSGTNYDAQDTETVSRAVNRPCLGLMPPGAISTGESSGP